VNKLVSITAILMCSAAAACGAPPNPLLGKWKLVPGTARGYKPCATSMVFTNATMTLTGAGKPATENVYYDFKPPSNPITVYVHTRINDMTTHMTVDFTSKDKMEVTRVKDRQPSGERVTTCVSSYQRD
jgi:hypothetical protein